MPTGIRGLLVQWILPWTSSHAHLFRLVFLTGGFVFNTELRKREMKSKKCLKATLAALALLGVSGMSAGSARAALFADAFDSAASGSNFLVPQIAGSTDTITFGYDYSANGIAEAPSSTGTFAATRGLFIAANTGPVGAINGINVTAAAGGVAINFAQDIKMSFDMWLGFDTGLVSTTEQAVFGINTDGLGVNSRTGATQAGTDGVWYHIASEGGVWQCFHGS